MTPPMDATEARGSGAAPPPDAWRVEVYRRAGFEDPAGAQALAALREAGFGDARSVRVGRGTLLSRAYPEPAVRAIAAELLADPVVDEARVHAPGAAVAATGAHRILVMARPGVTDPVAGTIARLLARSGRLPPVGDAQVATFRVYEVAGDLSREELGEAAARILANETVEAVRVDREDLPYGLQPPSAPRGRVEVALRDAGDEELQRVSREGTLSLTLGEMRAIRDHFREAGREPTACELETLAQTWSEHCKHKTLRGVIEFTGPDGTRERIDDLLATTIAAATRELARPWCISVFVDNAGIVEIDDGWDVAVKVETHNHPSAIDPYGGAGTGVGGVVRDVLGAGLGAKPIANLDAFFVGPLDLPRDAVPRGTLHPRRILRGVVAGVRDYGNRMGIPTVAGGVWFDERYVANPLVYCGTVGLMPRWAAEKEVRPGDAVVLAGGRTGRDGIHGATFSSLELSERSEELSTTAVQIGDPITEKRVQDALLRARDQRLYRAVTDCGAGGLSSAVGEMGERCGAEVDVATVPLKYPGLSSHEIWISEAQERMVFAVPPENVEELLSVFAAEGAEATVIGRFTDTGRLVVRDGQEVVGELDMEFLHGGTPRPVREARWSPPELPDPGCPPAEDAGAAVLALLARPNVASVEWIVRQYDHEVQGRSAAKPLVGPRGDGPGDAAVLQPRAESPTGIAIAVGACPAYGDLDPEGMAMAAIDEALRNTVAVGGDPERTAILDNFSWGNCDVPDRLGSLVLAAKGCRAAALAYGAPFVSGKDSLNNEYRVGDRTISIPGTLLVTAVARVPDVARVVTMDPKRAGDRVYLVGATRAELGGSEWLAHLGLLGGRAPRPSLSRAPRILRALAGEIAAGRVAACHDLSEGGLAVAAAEMAFAGGLGLSLDLAAVPWEGPEEPGTDPDAARLFSESCTRFLVEVAPEHAGDFERALAGLPCAAVGAVLDEPVLAIRGTAGADLARVAAEDLRAAFTGGFAG